MSRLEDVLGSGAAARPPAGDGDGVVFDAGRECVLGLEATGRDGVRRFLPWVAVELAGNAADRLAAGSRRHGELDGYARLCAVVVRDPLQLAGVDVGREGASTHVESEPGVSPLASSGIRTR